MAKISKSAAETAAIKIAEPIKLKSHETNDKMETFITDLYVSGIPKDVIKMYAQYPEYIQTTRYVYVRGAGITNNYQTVYFKNDETHPAIKQNGNVPSFELSQKDAVKYCKLRDEKESWYKKYIDTQKEIENTILALGTHKKVAENMPEALKFLPDTPTNTGLIVSIAPVREKVKCLIGESEDKKCMQTI